MICDFCTQSLRLLGENWVTSDNSVWCDRALFILAFGLRPTPELIAKGPFIHQPVEELTPPEMW